MKMGADYNIMLTHLPSRLVVLCDWSRYIF